MENITENMMKKMIIAIGGVVIVIAVLLAVMMIGQKRIAYVDNGQILDGFSGTAVVRDEMKSATEGYQAQLSQIKADIEKLRNKFINDSVKLGAAESERLKKEIAGKEKELNDYSQFYNNELSKLEQQKMGPVIEAVNKRIKQYGDTHGYDIIFGATSNGNIVYAKNAVNITRDVLKYLNAADKKNPDSSAKTEDKTTMPVIESK